MAFGFVGDAFDWAGGVAGDVFGGAGDAGKGLLEVGKSNYRATNFGDTTQYDPSRFQYGGTPGGAHEAASRYASLGQDAQSRQGPQVNYAQAEQARGQQQQMAGLMAARAQGQVPSIAGQQAGFDMQRAQAAQMAGAASARGGAGIALAQQNAANNTANAFGQISNQAQINAANERMQAEQAAFGAYGGMRGQDAQQAQYQAQLQAQQRAQNDQFQLGMTGHEVGVRNSQLTAGLQQQGLLSGSLDRQQAINSKTAEQRSGIERSNLEFGIGMGMDAAKMGVPASPPGKAMGGPIAGGQPYLVGELGPEMILPSTDGYVVPNHHLGGLLSGTVPANAGSQGGASPTFAGASGLLGGNVAGEYKAHADAATRFQRHPGGY